MIRRTALAFQTFGYSYFVPFSLGQLALACSDLMQPTYCIFNRNLSWFNFLGPKLDRYIRQVFPSIFLVRFVKSGFKFNNISVLQISQLTIDLDKFKADLTESRVECKGYAQEVRKNANCI